PRRLNRLRSGAASSPSSYRRSPRKSGAAHRALRNADFKAVELLEDGVLVGHSMNNSFVAVWAASMISTKNGRSRAPGATGRLRRALLAPHAHRWLGAKC